MCRRQLRSRLSTTVRSSGALFGFTGFYLFVFAPLFCFFFFSSRRRHTRSDRDWSSDVCSSDLDELSNQRPVADRPQIADSPGDEPQGAVLPDRKNLLPVLEAARPRLPPGAGAGTDRKSVV